MADGGEVKIKITGDDSQFKSTINKLGSAASTGLKATAAAAGAASGAVAVAGAAVIKLGKDVVQSFGELEQNLGGSEAVFGQYAQSIQKTAEDAYKNMGVSQSEYLATANKMGALFQGSGIEQQKSLDLTTKAMQRAADMASVMGIDMEWALESVAGAAKGNFTMMDNLGVAMNATNIEAYALSKGLDFVWNKATQAEKAEMAMMMFFETTEQYAGNFARESTQTITGSIGLLEAAVSSFTAGLGNADADMSKLAKNVTDAFGAVVDNVVPVIENVIEVLPTAIEALLDGFGELAPAISETVTVLFSDMIDAILDYAPKASPAIAEFVLTLGDLIVKNAPKLIDAGVELLEYLVDGISKNSDKAASAMVDIAKAIVSGIERVIPQITAAAGKIISSLASELGNAVPILTPITSVISLLADNINSLIPMVLSAGAAFATFKTITTIVATIQSLVTAFQAINTVLTAYQAATAASQSVSLLLASTMTPLQLAVGVLTGKVSLATAAQTAWNAVMNANPIGLIITAVAALAVGIGVLVATTNKATDAELEHQKQIEESIERTNELSDAMQSQKQAYESNVKSIEQNTDAKLSEIDRTKELANELMTLADSEGNVSAANQARVDFILGELNEAYGTEYLLIDGQIQKYSELKDKIYEVIEAEKAKAILSSYSSQLQEAYANEAEAADNAKQAVSDLSTQYAERQAIIDEFFATGTAWHHTMFDEASAAEYLSNSNDKLAKKYQEVDAAIKANEEAIKYHAETEAEVATKEAQYSEAATQVKLGNYDKVTQMAALSAEQRVAVASGEGEKIKAAIEQNNAEIEQLEQLRGQTSDEAIKSEYDSMIATARERGEILKQAYSELGQGAGEKLAEGVEQGGENAKQAAQTVAESGKEGFKAVEETSEIGQNATSNLASGISSGGGEAVSAASGVAAEVQNAFEPINEIPSSISNATGDIASSMQGGMEQLPTSATEKITAVKTAFDDGFNEIKSATSAAMQEIVTTVSSTDLYSVGANVIQGLINGMNSKLAALKTTAASIAATVAEVAKLTLDIHSPSRVFAEIGKNVMLGLANGLEDNARLAWYAIYESTERLLDTESLYLKEKQRLEDEAFDKEYQEKLDNAESAEEIEEIKQEYTLKAQEEGQEQYLENLKALAEAERKQLEKMQDTAEDIADRRNDLINKLNPFDNGGISTTVTDNFNGFEYERTGLISTKELNELAAANQEYTNLLMQINAIEGLPTEVYEALLNADRADGYQIAQDILNMTPEELNEWISAWETAEQSKIKSADTIFADEASALAQALIDDFGEVPEEFFDVGEDSAEQFGYGFMEQLKSIVSEIKSHIQSELSSAVSVISSAGAGASSNVYNASYYIQPSAGESTQAQLLAIKSAEKINKYRMG